MPACDSQTDWQTEDGSIYRGSIASYDKTIYSAAADRPVRRSGSAHAKYSVSYYMVMKPFLLLGLAAEYRSRRWLWSTVVRRP